MYYLQSRYYDAALGRFVNADDSDINISHDVRETNLFAYCINDPVNNDDFEGNLVSLVVKKILQVLMGALSSVAVFFISHVIICGVRGKWKKPSVKEIIKEAAAGAWDGLWNKGIVVSVGASMIKSVIKQAYEMIKNKAKFDVVEFVMPIFDGILSYGIEKVIKVPKHIRDIKKRAREKGIKGTKKLLKYLNNKMRIFKGIKLTFKGIAKAIKTFIESALYGICDFAKELMNNLKNDVKVVVNG